MSSNLRRTSHNKFTFTLVQAQHCNKIPDLCVRNASTMVDFRLKPQTCLPKPARQICKPGSRHPPPPGQNLQPGRWVTLLVHHLLTICVMSILTLPHVFRNQSHLRRNRVKVQLFSMSGTLAKLLALQHQAQKESSQRHWTECPLHRCAGMWWWECSQHALVQPPV